MLGPVIRIDLTDSGIEQICRYPSPPFFTYFVLFDIPTGMYENDLL